MINKKKIVFATLAIVVLILASNIQAKTIKQDPEIETDEEPTCIGFLHGSVGKSHSYAWESFPFALVDAEIKKTRCGILGIYRMFLPLGRTYNVTAYAGGYKPLTKQVTLTKEQPEKLLNFDFIESEPENIESKDKIVNLPVWDIIMEKLMVFLNMRFGL